MEKGVMLDPTYLSKVLAYLLNNMGNETKIAIAKISGNPPQFIEAVKYLIDHGQISQHQFVFDGEYQYIKKGTTFDGLKKYKLINDKIIFYKDIDQSTQLIDE
jgi:hypothetical protein